MPTDRDSELITTRSAVLGAVMVVLILAAGTVSTLRPLRWNSNLVITLAWWAGWLLLLPVIYAIVKRNPFHRGRVGRSVFAHLLAASVLSALHILLLAYLTWTLSINTRHLSFAEISSRLFGSIQYLVFDFTTYGAMAALLIAAAYARADGVRKLEAEQLATRTAQLEASVTQARLDALRMELNPHFLFNALNAVSGLVGRNMPNEAQDALGRLGGLLRETLSRDKSQFTTVSRELELLQDFLHIEKVRFGERLSMRVSCDSMARQLAIPTLLLQPLVENAVRHGIEPTLQTGEIMVDVWNAGDALHVSIENSGRGFDFRNGHVAQEGIGISNTRARLEQLFGAKGVLLLSNREGGGARVEVRLPATVRSEHAERPATGRGFVNPVALNAH